MAALTFDDAQELVRYIVLHPELQAQLRPVILSAELLNLPDLVRRNSEAIEQLGERMDQLTARVDDLTAAVNTGFNRAEVTFARIDAHIDELRRLALDNWYERRMRSIVGWMVRRPVITGVDRMERVEDARERGLLTAEDWDSLVQADMIVTGTLAADRQDIALTIQISFAVDQHDIEGAAARAALLEKCGYRAIGLVAGKLIRTEEVELGETIGVGVLLGARILHWPAAA